MRVIGLAGWSGAGKTTLLVRLIPELERRGLSVSTLKHAHHEFDVDQPGKDSYRHRAAGAREVLVASVTRVALMRELRGDPELRLAELLGMLAPVDLVIVEGFKRERHAKIEIRRAGLAKPALYPDDADIVGIIDSIDPASRIPYAHIDDVVGAADLLIELAEPIDVVLEKLGRG
jgi:molybdopterin-guanine dinucleotide biosynthesis adapter protein